MILREIANPSSILSEQSQNLLMALGGDCLSFLPNRVQSSVFDPTHFDGSRLPRNWVAAYVKLFSKILQDEVLEIYWSSPVPALPAVFNINLFRHNL